MVDDSLEQDLQITPENSEDENDEDVERSQHYKCNFCWSEMNLFITQFV